MAKKKRTKRQKCVYCNEPRLRCRPFLGMWLCPLCDLHARLANGEKRTSGELFNLAGDVASDRQYTDEQKKRAVQIRQSMANAREKKFSIGRAPV